MLLTGTFPRTMDEKQRVAIPKRLRDAFQQDEGPLALYVAPGTDGSLALYTEDSFSSLAARLSASPPTGQDVRAFSRLFYSQAQRVELDRQGRVTNPARAGDAGGLGKGNHPGGRPRPPGDYGIESGGRPTWHSDRHTTTTWPRRPSRRLSERTEISPIENVRPFVRPRAVTEAIGSRPLT